MITSTRLESVLLELASTIDAALEAGPEAYKVEHAARKLLKSLEGGLLENQGNPIVVEMHDSLFVHRDLPLMQASLQSRSAIAFLRVIGSGGIALEDGLNVGQVVRFVKLVCASFDRPMPLEAARMELLGNGIIAIGLLDPHDDKTWSLAIDSAAEKLYEAAGFELETAAPVQSEVAHVVEQAMAIAAKGEAIQMDEARTVSEHLHEASRQGFSDLFQLGERPEYDAFTVQHSLRVALLATNVADYIGAPREIVTEDGAAALVYVPVGQVTETEQDFDINNDGDLLDTFDLGRIVERAWDGNDTANGTSRTALIAPLILQEADDYGSDLDGDGLEDPMFLWTPESGRLRLRLFALVGDLSGREVIRRFETVLYLRNGSTDE